MSKNKVNEIFVEYRRVRLKSSYRIRAGLLELELEPVLVLTAEDLKPGYHEKKKIKDLTIEDFWVRLEFVWNFSKIVYLHKNKRYVIKKD